jgi:hypothetical protein
MIPVSVPLIFPKVVPNDWNIWNKVWEKNKNRVTKIAKTKNSGQVDWIGFDIYVKDGVDASDVIKYSCENVNCPELFPSLFDNLDILPIDVQVVRVLQSLGRVPAHQDFAIDSNYQSVRSILYDNNPKQTWWYEDTNNKKHYLKLPEETNTWWYSDAKIKHGTDFYPGYNKQLIMYRGTLKEELMTSTLTASTQKYLDYVIHI